MKDTPKGSKKRPKLVESFNNVPHILEKARQAVDEVTQTPPEGSREAKPARRVKPRAASPGKPKAAPPKKSAKETGRPQRTAPVARPPRKTAPAAAAPAPETPREPLVPLAYYGISVKHAIPGRVRLRLGRMLHNEALADQLPPLLATVPGVTSAEASAATGSLLITFSSRELSATTGRQNLAKVMRQFFPGLDTETLVKRMLVA
ncbi:MAG: HMA2 domain-containing protein [Thermodesulfobacteriota bacterium]